MDHGVLSGARRLAVLLCAGTALMAAAIVPAVPAQAAVPTVVQTATVPSFPSTLILKVGSRGVQVSAVQRALIKRGYRIGTYTAGVYNSNTARAVKRFKDAHPWLGPPGPTRYQVGPRTYREITKVLASASPWAAWRARSSYAYTTASYARWYAAKRLAAYGWTSAQMDCLRPMWIAESHWSYRAASGSYLGIPQTTSGTVSRYGFSLAAYRANPEVQVEVGLRYIRDRYKSPCAAWSFWKAQGATQDPSNPAQWWGGWY